VARHVEERSSKDIAAKGGGYGYNAQFPLKDVAPGRYVLRVEAKARLKDAPTATRELLVTVLATPAELKKGPSGE
jgi:hypothetical protein